MTNIDNLVLDVIAKQVHKNTLMGHPNKWVSIAEITDGIYRWMGMKKYSPESVRKSVKKMSEANVVCCTKRKGRLRVSLN